MFFKYFFVTKITEIINIHLALKCTDIETLKIILKNFTEIGKIISNLVLDKLGGTLKEKGNIILKVKEQNELMKFLIENLPGKNRNNIKSLLKNKQVLVDRVPISQFNHIVEPGQEIMITRSRLQEKEIKGIKVVYEDEYLIAVEKSSGILSIATDKERDKTAYNMVKNYVKSRNPHEKLFIVHRLDRETSGVMIFAKQKRCSKFFKQTGKIWFWREHMWQLLKEKLRRTVIQSFHI